MHQAPYLEPQQTHPTYISYSRASHSRGIPPYRDSRTTHTLPYHDPLTSNQAHSHPLVASPIACYNQIHTHHTHLFLHPQLLGSVAYTVPYSLLHQHVSSASPPPTNIPNKTIKPWNLNTEYPQNNSWKEYSRVIFLPMKPPKTQFI